MKDLFDLLGIGASLMPAIVISGIVYKLFGWAQVRLPAASDYVRAWITGTAKPISLGSLLLDFNGLLIGHRWREPRRLGLIVVPSCAALAWLMLSSFTSKDPLTVDYALGDLRSMLLELPIAIAEILVVCFIVGTLSFALYDRVTARLPVPVTNRGALRTYLVVTAACGLLVFVGYLAIGFAIWGPLMTLMVTPMLFTFHVPTCVDAFKDFGCTVSGEIDGSLMITFYCFLALASVPVILLFILSTTLVLVVGASPGIDRVATFITRKYFAVTDQKLALEKPLEFVAPVAAVVAFAISAGVLYLIRSFR